MTPRRTKSTTTTALRRSAGVAFAVTALTTGAVVAAPAHAAQPGSAPAAVSSPLKSGDCKYGLWTQRGYGYADVCIRWTKNRSGGGYHGLVWGATHHYHAPDDRQVAVQMSLDGHIYGKKLGATYSSGEFQASYKHTNRVLVRTCLYRPGASGVSFCGPWW
ncbi:hypothetical protein ACWEO4_34475 [Streptomyces sp. NPDC004393]|uniref:hypothetical protein n=1 Tax=Streptomyces sp. NPDC004533 TaxID=3154278 RepID=UPI0033A8D70E